MPQRKSVLAALMPQSESMLAALMPQTKISTRRIACAGATSCDLPTTAPTQTARLAFSWCAP
eukprot:scaffold99243_cov17-Tisochrysis_lutea.AAC.2